MVKHLTAKAAWRLHLRVVGDYDPNGGNVPEAMSTKEALIQAHSLSYLFHHGTQLLH